jgi:hypothetical protein
MWVLEGILSATMRPREQDVAISTEPRATPDEVLRD